MKNAFTGSFGHDDSVETSRDAHGRFYRASIHFDEAMGAPWEEKDGHGAVRKVARFEDGDKAPGERVLYRGDSRHYTFLYDWQGAARKAKAEGWGCSKHEHVTPGEQRACAVQQDFDHLRGYLEDQWTWVGIRLDLVQKVDNYEVALVPGIGSLWGMSSDDTDYLTEVANELLAEAKASPEAARLVTREGAC